MTEPARPAPSRTRRALVVLVSALAVIAVAVLSAFILQLSTHLDWGNRPSSDVLVSPVDVVIITVVIAGVWAVIGRLGWSLSLVAGLATLLAGISHTKVVLRREPLLPADRSFVSESSSLLGMVDVKTALGIVVGVVGVVAAVAVVGRFVGRRFPGSRSRPASGGPDVRLLGVRLVTLLLSAGLLVHATHFNQPHNLWRGLYDVKADWTPWSQMQNYRSNGFVGGFLYNMPVAVMDQPTDYDAETMTRIGEHYTERAAQINAGREGSLADANVVFVLSESFTDPSWLEGFTLAENPVPATQEVMSQSIAGRMHALSYGGGTATMEFESLTGQPVGLFNAQMTSPYQMFVGDRATYPSVVGAFAELGHRTVAIHSFSLDMYKRKQVYRAFGFDEVVDDAAMQSQERIDNGRYISDAAAFNEVLYQLDRHEGPEFINLVTMQNHGTYQDFYPDPIGSNLADPDKAEEYGQYARGLAHTDAALADFLTRLQARDETTIVVFYGDHHPGIYDDELMSLNEPDGVFDTPFFVWNSTTQRTQTVEVVSPAMFLALVHEAADAPVSPYVALLDDVRHTVPVLQPSRTLDAQGLPVEPGDLDGRTAALVEDLRMVQYDFSVGERYAIEAMWPGALFRQAS